MNTVRTFFRTHLRTLAVCFALLLCAGLLLTGGRAEAASVLRLPAGLKTIEASAFENDKSLDVVILPDGLERIESRAFAGSGVLTVHIPASVTYIAPDAFDGIECLNVEVEEGTWAAEWWASVRDNFISKPEILTQPVHQYAAVGNTVTFTVTAENADSIQWQVDRADGNGFVDLKENTVWHGVKTDTLTFTAIAAREAFTFRALAKNRAGAAPSEAVQFTLAPLPEIVTQPENQQVLAGGTVTFTVEAKNADSYLWQYDRGDGMGFTNLPNTSIWQGSRTNTLRFPATSARSAYRFRVLVSNLVGEVLSEPVQFTVMPKPRPVFVVQPAHQDAPAGQMVVFTVETMYADSIRWQADRGDGKGFIDLPENSVWQGTQTNSLTFKAVLAREPYTFQAVATNEVGDTISDPVQFTVIYPPEIVTQPANQEVASGNTVTFTVAFENADSIRWQADKGDGAGFADLPDQSPWNGVGTDTLSFKAVSSAAGYLFRAVASNAAGETPSEPAQYTIVPMPKIVTQPAHQYVPNGEMVSFTVKTEYASAIQWQVDRGDGNGFVDLPENSAWQNTQTETLTFKAIEARKEFKFQAVVSNIAGTVVSSTVQFTIMPLPSFTRQPADQEALLKETVAFTVETENADSIQWQVDRQDGKGFVNLSDNSAWQGTQTDTLTFKAIDDREPYTFRAVAKNKAGEKNSEEVRFTIIRPPVIVTQPVHQDVADGETVTFTVAAENADSIRWQVDRGDSNGFVDLKESTVWQNVNTDTLTFTASAARELYIFRAVAKNRAGETPSKPVQFTISSLPIFVTQPADQVAGLGETVTFTVETENADSIRWQVDRQDGKGFVNLNENDTWHGVTTDALSFSAHKDRLPYRFRAVAKNDIGETESDVVRFRLPLPAPVIRLLEAIDNTVLLEWDGVDDAESYNLYYGTTEECDTLYDTFDGSADSVTIWQGLAYDTTYYFRLSAMTEEEESEKSDAESVVIGPEMFEFWVITNHDEEDPSWDRFALLNKYTGDPHYSGNIVIPSLHDGVPVEGILSQAFIDCGGLTGKLIIPDSVTSIGDYAFYGCSGLTGSLTIPDSVTSIGEYVFKDCSSFTGSLIIPDSVTSIGISAFSGCSGFDGNLSISKNLTSIEETAFYNCSGFTGSLIIPDGVISVGFCAFSGCSGFNGILIIPDSVSSIDNGAFQYCSGLTGSLTIPSSVTTIGDEAFKSCSGFTGSLTISSGLIEIGASAFVGCFGFTGTLKIPSGVTTIGDYAFASCSGFTGSVIIPASVNEIGFASFSDCSGIDSIEVASGNSAFCSSEGVLFDKNKTLLILYPQGKTDESYSIPEGVIIIEQYAFDQCAYLKSVHFPDSILNIGHGAFYQCCGLQSLNLPDNLTEIGGWAFWECFGLQSLNLPDNLTEIGEAAFWNCYNLTGNLTIPNNVTRIDDAAFGGCYGLNGSLTIPGSVTSIGKYAFEEDSNLEKIDIPVVQEDGSIINSQRTAVYCPLNSYAWSWAIENNYEPVPIDGSTVHDRVVFSMTKDGRLVDEVTVGTVVHFNVSVPAGAVRIRLIADGVVYEERPVSDIPFDRVISRAGERQIQIRCEFADGRTLTSEPQRLNVISNGTLVPPEDMKIDVPQPIYLGRSERIHIEWTAIPLAQRYTLYLYQENVGRIWPGESAAAIAEATTENTYYDLDMAVFPKADQYNIQVVCSGEGYSSCTVVADFQVQDAEVSDPACISFFQGSYQEYTTAANHQKLSFEATYNFDPERVDVLCDGAVIGQADLDGERRYTAEVQLDTAGKHLYNFRAVQGETEVTYHRGFPVYVYETETICLKATTGECVLKTHPEKTSGVTVSAGRIFRVIGSYEDFWVIAYNGNEHDERFVPKDKMAASSGYAYEMNSYIGPVSITVMAQDEVTRVEVAVEKTATLLKNSPIWETSTAVFPSNSRNPDNTFTVAITNPLSYNCALQLKLKFYKGDQLLKELPLDDMVFFITMETEPLEKVYTDNKSEIVRKWPFWDPKENPAVHEIKYRQKITILGHTDGIYGRLSTYIRFTDDTGTYEGFVLGPGHTHVIRKYYDSSLNEHTYCVYCEPRTEEQKLEDAKNLLIHMHYIGYLAGINLLSRSDDAGSWLADVSKANEGWAMQFGHYYSYVVTLDVGSVVTQIIPGSEDVMEMEKEAVNAVLSTLMAVRPYDEPPIAEYTEGATAFLDMLQAMDEVIKTLVNDTQADAALLKSVQSAVRKIKTAVKNTELSDIGVGINTLKTALTKLGGNYLSKYHNIEEKYHILEAKLKSDNTFQAVSVLAKWAIDHPDEIAEYYGLSQAKKELLIVCLYSARRNTVMLNKIKETYSLDNEHYVSKVITEECTSTLEGINKYYNQGKVGELIDEISKITEEESTIQQWIKWLGKNDKRLLTNFGFGKAIKWITGKSVTAFKILGFGIRIAFKDHFQALKAFENADILYKDIVQFMDTYGKKIVNSSQLPDYVTAFAAMYMGELKSAGMELMKDAMQGTTDEDVFLQIQEMIDNAIEDVKNGLSAGQADPTGSYVNALDKAFLVPAGSGINKTLVRNSVALANTAYNGIASIRVALSKLGFEDIVGKSLTSGQHTVGHYFGHKMIKDENGKDIPLFICVIRGTNGTAKEWRSNFTPYGTGSNFGPEYHYGFKTAENLLIGNLLGYIQQYYKSPYANKDYKLWICGHSRGAAVGNLLAEEFCSKNLLDPKDVYAYLFATPNVTTAPKTNLNNIYNFINPGDLVPRLPYGNYRRNGREIFNTNQGAYFAGINVCTEKQMDRIIGTIQGIFPNMSDLIEKIDYVFENYVDMDATDAFAITALNEKGKWFMEKMEVPAKVAAGYIVVTPSTWPTLGLILGTQLPLEWQNCFNAHYPTLYEAWINDAYSVNEWWQ